MPDQRLVPERQRLEAVGVDLHDRGFVDPFEQIFPFDRRRARPLAAPVAGGAFATSPPPQAPVPIMRHHCNSPLQHARSFLAYPRFKSTRSWYCAMCTGHCVLCAMRARQGLERHRFAMHEVGHRRRSDETGQPAHDLARVGVRRHRVDPLDVRRDRDVAARGSSPASRRRTRDVLSCRRPGSRRTARCCGHRAARRRDGAARVRRSPCRSTRSRSPASATPPAPSIPAPTRPSPCAW